MRKHLSPHRIWCGIFLLFLWGNAPAAKAQETMLASAPSLPNEHVVKAAGKDCRRLHSVLNDLLTQLEPTAVVPVSQQNVVGNQVRPATPGPSGVLNNGYTPLKPKQIAACCDKIRESSLILADELNQVTETPALAVFDSTKAIKEGEISLNSSWQKLLNCLAEHEIDRLDASKQVHDLLQTVDKIESELKKYHPPLK